MYQGNKEAHFDEIDIWIKQINWAEIKLLFLPVFLQPNHWAMAVFEPRKKIFRMFDSKIELKRTKEKVDFMEMMEDFIKLIAIMHNKPFNEELTAIENTNVPQQGNDSDCGVFALMFAYYIGKKKQIPDTFNHCNMDARAFREKIYLEISAGKRYIYV
jgi:sentrin-specific protease 1